MTHIRREVQLSQLLAMSFDSPASPAITLKHVVSHKPHDPYGWGFAWYPSGDYAALVIKDPTTIGDNSMTRMLRDWERFRATAFVCHLRGAAQRIRQEDTHPFCRSYAGRDWIIAHNGDLEGDLKRELPLGEDPTFEPVGHTDTEHAFCWLLTMIRSQHARSLADVGWPRLHEWLQRLDELGTANFVFTDGHDLAVYNDQGLVNQLHYIRRQPPHERMVLETEELSLDLSHALDVNRTAVLVATHPLSDEEWRPMQAGQLLVLRRGTILWDSHGEKATPTARVRGAGPLQARPTLSLRRPDERVLTVTHETVYGYEEPVERSNHLFRLHPVHDLAQEVLETELEISADGVRRDFEDVFGNHVTRLEIEQPFSEMRILARSRVRLLGGRLMDLQLPVRRHTIPLVWMPWQRQMMQAYLLPPELAETQLRELSEYAMSFVERHDYDLVETLIDINETIHREYAYVQGSTSVHTTPWEVYVDRQGVCQDFANLFICLARLLNIPARYRVGYIYTGGSYENKVQSEASHAWVELYFSWLGWRGFDPTNGCLAGLDHVRVACGRNYRDATPTSGTIYKGGGKETLEVSVRVDEESPDSP